MAGENYAIRSMTTPTARRQPLTINAYSPWREGKRLAGGALESGGGQSILGSDQWRAIHSRVLRY